MGTILLGWLWVLDPNPTPIDLQNNIYNYILLTIRIWSINRSSVFMGSMTQTNQSRNRCLWVFVCLIYWVIPFCVMILVNQLFGLEIMGSIIRMIIIRVGFMFSRWVLSIVSDTYRCVLFLFIYFLFCVDYGCVFDLL